MNLITKQSLSVVADTDGFNSLVASVVNKICENTGLQVIDKISHGSEEFDGFPIYNKIPSFGESSYIFHDDAHQSDVYILGLNANNYCLVINVHNGYLLFSLGCSKSYDNRYVELLTSEYPTYVKFSPLGCVTRTDVGLNAVDKYGRYNLHIPLKKNSNEIINLVIASYKGSNSQGFKFITDGNESEWVLFSRDEDDNRYVVFDLNQMNLFSNCQVFGSDTRRNLNYQQKSLVIRLNDEIPLYKEMIINNDVYSSIVKNQNTQVENNAYYILDYWFSHYERSFNSLDYAAYAMHKQMARTNTINYGQKYNLGNETSADKSFIFDSLSTLNSCCPTNCIYNLPKLQEGQVYLRKMFAPNSNKKFNYYLWYSPVTATPAPNSFYEIAGDVYLLSSPGCIGYAIKV